MPLRVPVPAGLSRPAAPAPGGVRVLRAESRRPRLGGGARYLPALVVAATVDDWRLAAAAGLPLPDTRLRWALEATRAVVVGHAGGRCPVPAALPAGDLAELLTLPEPQVPGTYELALCPVCRPAPLAWYVEVTGLAVRCHAVALPLRTGAVPASVAWELVPVLVSALGTAALPTTALRAAVRAAGAAPEQALERFTTAVRDWAGRALEETLRAVERSRDRLYDDAWLAKTLKMAGLDPDVDPAGPAQWVFVDVGGALAAARRPGHKLLCALLLHRTRCPVGAASPDGRWWAVPVPQSWLGALPAGAEVRAAGPARPLEDDPVLLASALQLWRDAATGALEDALSDPAAALAAARELLG